MNVSISGVIMSYDYSLASVLQGRHKANKGVVSLTQKAATRQAGSTSDQNTAMERGNTQGSA